MIATGDNLTIDEVAVVRELAIRGVPINQITTAVPSYPKVISEYVSIATETDKPEYQQQLLGNCPERTPEAIEYLAVRGLSYKQIAKHFGCNYNTVHHTLKGKCPGWQEKRDRYRRQLIERYACVA